MIAGPKGINIGIFISMLVITLITALGEEIGWRGFALPRLQKRFNALTSALILGIFWGVWHIPMLFAFGMTTKLVLIQVITVVAYSVTAS